MRLLKLLLGTACLLAAHVTAEDKINTTVKMISPTYNEVLLGGSVTLTCEFWHIGADDLVIWKKEGDRPIFMDFDMAFNDNRYNLNMDDNEPNGRRLVEMTINDISLEEDTVFFCGTMNLEPELYAQARVRVTVKPTAHITPDVWPYTVLLLEPVTLRCQTSGNPLPTVRWSKEGGAIGSHVSVEGDSLRIPSVKKSDDGVYTCKVNNSAGEAVSKTHMIVHDPHEVSSGPSQPWIRTSDKYVPVEMNGAVNISCQYDGNPSPHIEWSFNGARLSLHKPIVRNSDIKQFASRQANYSESTLQISGASADYFGDYSCKAVNNRGTANDVVYVTALPSPPELSIDGTILTMTAMAPNGIDKFDLFFRRPDENGWLNKREIVVNKSDQTGDKTWSKQVELTNFIDESGKLEIQVQARNSYGSGNKAVDAVKVEMPMRSHVPTASASLITVSSITASLLFILSH